MRHPDARVRWAAAFAFDQIQTEIVRAIVARDVENDISPQVVLCEMASADPDESVRSLAAQALVGVVDKLASLLRGKASKGG